jgi:hypothetical protein
MKKNVLADLKSFNWDKIIAFGNTLGDLNDQQWRFIKGLVAELIVEKHSGKDGLKYVGALHKDYDWPKYGLTVELKSQLSGSMYTKKGELKKSFGIKLNNSNGTNKKKVLPADQVADLLIVVRDDGAFVLDKETVMKYAVATGDGFDVKVPNAVVIPLTEKIIVENVESTNLKAIITDAIRKVLV